MNRTNDWTQRVFFPTSAKTPLGWGYEYWELDPTRYEGHAELKARALTLGRHWTKSRLAAELTDNLLNEVITAAGGVEHSLIALRSAAAAAQQWADQYVANFDPNVPSGIANEYTVAVWYEFANLLSWARVLEERFDRPHWQGKKLPRQGLLPALKPARLRARVEKLDVQLRGGPLGETRFLANFTLHAALLRSPNSGAKLDNNARVTLPIPDKTTGPIRHWKALTWNDQRDGLVYAEELWSSIESFMDDLITAFEKAVPRRLRKPPASPTEISSS